MDRLEGLPLGAHPARPRTVDGPAPAPVLATPRPSTAPAPAEFAPATPVREAPAPSAPPVTPVAQLDLPAAEAAPG